jgi:hypothetical protein
MVPKREKPVRSGVKRFHCLPSFGMRVNVFHVSVTPPITSPLSRS